MTQFMQFIQNHWQLWVGLAVIFILILINEFLMQKKRAVTLSTHAAIDKINHENAVVFDLRPIEAFQAGHIIDAIRVTEDDFLQQRMAKYKTQPIILVCPRGLQSATLANRLRQQGFTQPLVLAGGMTAWQTANLPIVKGKK